MEELKKETIEELEEVRDNLPSKSTKDSYNEIKKIVDNYDCESKEDLYLSDRFNELLEVVYDDDISYLISETDMSVTNIYSLVAGLDFVDDIYKLNAYMSLENLYDDDLEYAIDDLITELEGDE